jgi:hypothetical protein
VLLEPPYDKRLETPRRPSDDQFRASVERVDLNPDVSVNRLVSDLCRVHRTASERESMGVVLSDLIRATALSALEGRSVNPQGREAMLRVVHRDIARRLDDQALRRPSSPPATTSRCVICTPSSKGPATHRPDTSASSG